MTSKAASGKPAELNSVHASNSNTNATRKKSTSRSSAKKAGDETLVGTKKTGSRGTGSRATATRKTAAKTKRRTAKPSGPAVYASDVVAAVKAGSAKGSTVLPTTLEAAGGESLQLSPIEADLPIERRGSQVLRLAEEAFAMTGSWVVFYRTMLAPGGIVDQIFDTKEARRYFETTVEFAELLEMVTAIRSQDDSGNNAHEPSRVITVRMPRSMHEATIREAEELELSINAYCLTKLLQAANPRFTPLESGNRRGRRPGPQVTMTKVKIKK